MSAHPHTARAQRLPSKARVNKAHSVRRARQVTPAWETLVRTASAQQVLRAALAAGDGSLAGRAGLLPRASVIWTKGWRSSFRRLTGRPRATSRSVLSFATLRGAVSTLLPRRAGSAHQQVAEAL